MIIVCAIFDYFFVYLQEKVGGDVSHVTFPDFVTWDTSPHVKNGELVNVATPESDHDQIFAHKSFIKYDR